ncbi:MAG: hemerythrin domain-containing protein [Bacteroidales bacterium]|nr:hemerythrin domain-containing protein [Bacteroidales bacterium]
MRPGKNIKMSELVERNYHLIGILSRLGMKGSFSDRTVEEVCKRYNFDAETFLLLCSVYTDKVFKPTAEELQRCDVEDLLRYLHSSHEYYLDSALTSISPALEEMIAPTTPVQQKAIRKFYEDYRIELERHFAFEEDTVIPYIRQLLDGHRPKGFSIADFEQNHSNVDESLGDLKSIVMQSLPPECDGEKRMEVLSNIFHLQEDLRHHTYIEDKVLVPLVQMYEGCSGGIRPSKEPDGAETDTETLSDREKEVLILVAKGLLNKEIADRLDISINTVITHRKNITRKTGIKTAPGLTVYAILGGLVDIGELE